MKKNIKGQKNILLRDTQREIERGWQAGWQEAGRQRQGTAGIKRLQGKTSDIL